MNYCTLLLSFIAVSSIGIKLFIPRKALPLYNNLFWGSSIIFICDKIIKTQLFQMRFIRFACKSPIRCALF